MCVNYKFAKYEYIHVLWFYHQWAKELCNTAITIGSIEGGKFACADAEVEHYSKCWVFTDSVTCSYDVMCDMYNVMCDMCNVWYVMCDVWYVMCDVWCVICVMCDMCDVWCVMCDMCDVCRCLWAGPALPERSYLWECGCVWVQLSLPTRVHRSPVWNPPHHW